VLKCVEFFYYILYYILYYPLYYPQDCCVYKCLEIVYCVVYCVIYCLQNNIIEIRGCSGDMGGSVMFHCISSVFSSLFHLDCYLYRVLLTSCRSFDIIKALTAGVNALVVYVDLREPVKLCA